ncbi:MAG: aconitate hydratase AcnA [Actinobacteria bacterium]|nr:MAG: aconitate hydratase AcnA [Actinomycetota bacterium]REK40562.1 MAG: aconitate hydratase AcnA [Actinomycetota bacterium]
MTNDPFGSRTRLDTALGSREIARLDALDGTSDLPYSIKVLLESALRNLDGVTITEDDVRRIASYDAANVGEQEIPFIPGRVVLQDFTGVPAVVDLAAMRAAIVRMTGDDGSAQKVNPLIPADLVVDHSVQVDAFARPDALMINSHKEFERNQERYEFLKWGQSAFANFRVVPPATGIVHQVNLEYLAKVVWDDGHSLYPDSLVGTDSHTTMINGLGVVGWGVGGIEAEAAMVGQPIYMLLPEVVGFELTGKLPEGATATDLVLRVTEMLRKHGVVGKFVEFYGTGLADMPLANRATIANMAPEYGATIGFFPVDEQTLKYMRLTGRDDKLIDTVEQYYKAQGMWREDSHQITYSSELHLDMSTVEPSLAGPKRPQDRIDLSGMKSQWEQDLTNLFGKASPAKEGTISEWVDEGGRPTNGPDLPSSGLVEYDGATFTLSDGDVVISAITSCTNTSNPDVMVGAGLVARKARALGLNRKPWVKTSLAPGSKVVTEYLTKSGLLEDLEALGFHVVGYGCTTCIGNSGPLPEPISKAIHENDLVTASVLSGNRNFEGRISPDVRANYLASPPLVVAYAISGSVDWDPMTEPLGTDAEGNDVMLSDIWPTQQEIAELVGENVLQSQFTEKYADVFAGSDEWRAITTDESDLYSWNAASTYVQEPPFFTELTPEVEPLSPITGARVLAKLGDSVTTDHISPAGSIAVDSPAGKYLIENGVQPPMFNSYGSRRGNDRVMTRGTFANIRVKNQLAPGTEGGWTTDFTDGNVKSIYEAAMSYQDHDIPLVVLAGIDYGMGSSRDWAAKGTFLLGVKAVIAKSYERIHRSNLVMMGVLPLVFNDGEDADSLGLDGSESFDITLNDLLQPREIIQVKATHPDGKVTEFETTARVDTPIEVEYLRNGGILHYVLRQMASA